MSEPVKVSNLTFNETLGLSTQLMNRIDNLWQRVINTHAAIVGVMVFFSQSEHAFEVARLLVFSFYTVNILITWAALRQAYDGMRAAMRDIGAHPAPQTHGAITDWLTGQRYERAMQVRSLILVLVWGLVAYLMFGSWLGG